MEAAAREASPDQAGGIPSWLPAGVLDLLTRPGDIDRWDRQAARARYCARPVRLVGRIEQADRATGEVRQVYSTDAEFRGVLLKACGTRRASRCQPCADVYRADAYQLISAGLRGGKGMPETVAGHPRLFVTFTAPSFGPVHARTVRGGRVRACRPRDHARRCAHGRPVGCAASR
jgi:hypothetical protein